MLVLIVGPGLGGLCLANGLRKAGIDVQIFELQKSASEIRSGYGIHINAHGRHALQECLPESQWRRFQSVSTPAGTQMFFRDSDLRVLAERDDAKLLGELAARAERRGIGRTELRDILLDGVNDGGMSYVNWGKTFSNFEELSNGQVRVQFLDGTRVDGDVLVGADGPNSLIRKQHLPHINRLDLGIHAIAGVCLPTDELRTLVPGDLINGSLNNIVPHGKGWMFVSSWALSPINPGQLGERRATHIVWAYVVPIQESSLAASHFNANDMKNFVLRSIDTWSSGLRHLVTDTDASTISCIRMRSMPVLKPWNPSQVTLLGDAIHNMTPMAGVGANTALRDAELLADMLSKSATGAIRIGEAIGRYESIMRVYANEAVGLSKRNAVSASTGEGVTALGLQGIAKGCTIFSLGHAWNTWARCCQEPYVKPGLICRIYLPYKDHVECKIL